jgi:hypothetical protein
MLHVKEHAIKRVVLLGNIVIYCDAIYLVGWFIFTVILAISVVAHGIDEWYEILIPHLLLALHFTATIAVCLVLEHYNELIKERRERKRKRNTSGYTQLPGIIRKQYGHNQVILMNTIEDPNTATATHMTTNTSHIETQEQITIPISERAAFIFSWVIAVVVSCGTDILSLAESIHGITIHSNVLYYIEFIYSMISFILICLTVIWSIYVYFKINKTSNKIKIYISGNESLKYP